MFASEANHQMRGLSAIFAIQLRTMTISYNWLLNYLPLRPEPEELSRILTSLGLEVEHMEVHEAIRGSLKGLLIGKVIDCQPHPNADKLKVTRVDIGQDEALQIVCGAPNVATGQVVVVATVGTRLYPAQGEAFEIKKAKIRGEESQGMLCAEDEIGLGEGHAGIMVLPDHLQPGQALSSHIPVPEPDVIYEIGLTPNRMDAMSHWGVARDVCAYYAYHQKAQVAPVLPSVELPATNHLPDGPSITILNQEACSRYAGICLYSVRVGESPEWLKTRLKAIGLRSVNNIVDVTNFVMHECGQPLHAFDLDSIEGNTIEVKTLPEGTSFVALDGREIKLSSEDLMICDASKPLCIAGVYGGLHSGVKQESTRIFLESASFSAESVRKTSVKHGLRTDAATRFEKGTDIHMVPYALKRAAMLIMEIAGGVCSSKIQDLYPVKKPGHVLTISIRKINQLAGKPYSAEDITAILTALQFEVKSIDTDTLQVSVPSSKTDILHLADVVEEIMRVDGLDQIPFTGRIQFTMPENDRAYAHNPKNQISAALVAKGFSEIFTNSITNAAYYKNRTDVVRMMNSLSANLDAMRPSMLETGLEVIAYNLNRKNTQLKFYEFGKTYVTHETGFQETEMLALYVSGTIREPHWSYTAEKADLFYIRGIIESVFSILNLQFEITKQHRIVYRNQEVGSIYGVEQAVLQQMDIKAEVWYAELNWSRLKEALVKTKVRFEDIPKFPLVNRDLAIVVEKTVRYDEIQTAVRKAKSKLLKDVRLFDIFESEKLGKDKLSMALNLTFYDAQKTLTDGEVEDEMKQIQDSLAKQVGATIRS